jgi:uncharacterized membrane protein
MRPALRLALRGQLEARVLFDERLGNVRALFEVWFCVAFAMRHLR